MKPQPLLPAFLVLLPMAAANAQRNCPRGFDSKMYYFNALLGAPVEYPNFARPGGTVDGDAAWKVFPAEWYQRATNDTTAWNIRITMQVGNHSTARPSVFTHRAQIRWAKRLPSGWLVPDFDRGPLVETLAQDIAGVPFGGPWTYQPRSWQVNVPGFDPRVEPGLAAVVYGAPGEGPTTASVVLPLTSRGERYGRAPQPSFSGLRNGLTGEVTLLTPPLVPEATEFNFALGMNFAHVQLSASSASDSTDPAEDYRGIGAYYNDLASRGGRLRLYVEEDDLRNSGTGALAVPIFSLGRGTTTYPLPGLICRSYVDLASPLALMPIQWGMVGVFQTRDPYTNLSDAFAYTPWISIPQSAALVGARIHFEVLSVSLLRGFEGVMGTTNSYEFVLQ